MSILYLICGHGAGDSGATNGKYKESELVRKLGSKINDLADKEVILCDTSTNFYKTGRMNSYKFEKGAKVLELHLDSSSSKSAKGGHVIIHRDYKEDKYDKALAEMISREFPGRSKSIVKRGDLYNCAVARERGINYRLLECCFISNKDDLKKFNANIEHLAKEILKCFDIVPVKKMKTETDIAKEVIAGKWGNGLTRRSKLKKAGYDYKSIQAIVNKLLKG